MGVKEHRSVQPENAYIDPIYGRTFEMTQKMELERAAPILVRAFSLTRTSPPSSGASPRRRRLPFHPFHVVGVGHT
jgi:hypothetical protein